MAALASLGARALELPFKASFAHSSATRAAMQSLLVEARDEHGLVGFGEGCPREYVTGESLPGALAFVAACGRETVATVADLPSLAVHVTEQRRSIDANPAAWCAVELALLDLLGRQRDLSVEALLGLPSLTGSFRYTAVIGDASPPRFEAELARYLRAGFRDYKIKLSGDAARDAAKVGALRAAGIQAAQVRADGNNLWRHASEATPALVALDYRFAALEEPLDAGDFVGMARLAGALGCAIILDESALRLGQIERLPAGVRWLLNLRVSKMGGLLRSLELASRARDAGIGLIIGAHVGETSLLTRAALAVANACRQDVVAQEGAFGTHLLERDLVDPPLMFGAGGLLDAASVPAGAGFGLSPIVD